MITFSPPEPSHPAVLTSGVPLGFAEHLLCVSQGQSEGKSSLVCLVSGVDSRLWSESSAPDTEVNRVKGQGLRSREAVDPPLKIALGLMKGTGMRASVCLI